MIATDNTEAATDVASHVTSFTELATGGATSHSVDTTSHVAVELIESTKA